MARRQCGAPSRRSPAPMISPPAEWSQEVPEGRIVLDEFTGAATAVYRLRRAAYRGTLGDALAATGDAEGAAREYRRAVALGPRPETWRRLADLPGMPLAERVEALLRSWARSGGSDREALDLLRESGAFRTDNGLAATLDRFRFRAPEASRRRAPEGTSPYEAPFPNLTLAVEGGAWSSERSFSEGRSLLLYFPGGGLPAVRRGRRPTADGAPGPEGGPDRGGPGRGPRDPHAHCGTHRRRSVPAGTADGIGEIGATAPPHRSCCPPGYGRLPTRGRHCRNALARGAGRALRVAYLPRSGRFGPAHPEHVVPVSRRLPGRGRGRVAGGCSRRSGRK